MALARFDQSKSNEENAELLLYARSKGINCSENVPIANYMQIYNEKSLFKRTEKEMLEKIEGNYRWGLLVDRAASARDCIECADCEQACTQHLNIIERLKEIDGWEKKLNSRLARFLRFAKKVKRKLKSICRFE